MKILLISLFVIIYWCVVFERVVKYYVKKLYNCKGIEWIFVFLEVRREFLKFFGSIEVVSDFGKYDVI